MDMQSIRNDCRARRGLSLGLVALAVLGFGAQAQQPPHYWERWRSPPSASAAPLSAQSNQQMIAIPAGYYPIWRNDGARSERPRHEVSLASFRIDRNEVTNAAFAEYLNVLRLPVRGTAGIGQISQRNADAATVSLLGNAIDGSRPYPSWRWTKVI